MQLRSLFAFNIAVTALTFGKLVCFAPDDSAALAVMSMYKVDLALLSVYQLDVLVDRLRRGQGDLGSLREIQVGGSLTTDTLVTKARAVLSYALVSHYGSSEAGATALAPFERLAAQLKDGAVGFVAPWCRIEIVDDHGQARPLGRDGHVRIRGLALAPDYRPGMTRVEPPAFFLPGDHGRLLTGGLLLITGRTNDVLNIGGNKFSPERIEDVVAQCRGVREAAAVVVEFNATIPQVVVAVVADGPVDEADIRRRCADISPLAVPAAIRVVAALPRGPEGKLLREQLRRELTGARS